MTQITEQDILEELRRITVPGSDSDLVSQGMISDIVISNGKVMFSITVPAEQAAAFEPMRRSIEANIRDLPGVNGALVVLTAEKRAGAPNPPPRAQQPPARSQVSHPGPRPAHGQAPRRSLPGGQKAGVPGVNAIVAVASGKGGVGKSTTAVNLALALRANGLRVGILDADIYGPSLPRLLALKDSKPEIASGRILRPLDAYGVKAMSIGFLVEEEAPMIWRGPMVVSALTQMLREVEWGELDILIVDMPPGTGDAQLTMAQQVPLAGAVIVSTPQDLALIDARKGLNMFRRVDVPVLGIIENMSYFVCPHCGGRSDIFGHGGARHEADRLETPFLGEVPLDMNIRLTSDAGTPVVVAEPEGVHARIYREIAARIWQGVADERASGGRPPPRIVIE